MSNDNANRTGSISGGEHRNGRAAMDDLTRRLKAEGYSAEKAREIARETAIREDRKRNG